MTHRIQKRKFSSNIIEKGEIDENNKIKWTPYITPLVSKAEGDKICQEIFEYLTNKETK